LWFTGIIFHYYKNSIMRFIKILSFDVWQGLKQLAPGLLACVCGLVAPLAMAAISGQTSTQAAAHTAPVPVPHPKWFTETLLDFREDAQDAKKVNKRVLIYFGQDGCPYCVRLMKDTFGKPAIAATTQKSFVVIPLNIWGDRETTWIDGVVRSEKLLARHLKVQFTPSLLMLDEQGALIARINGYYPPEQMAKALQFGIGRLESASSFSDYMLQSQTAAKASGKLVAEPFFMLPPLDLQHKPSSKPLVVLIERPNCAPCAELHRTGFSQPAVRALLGKSGKLAKLNIAQINSLDAAAQITTPTGEVTTPAAWARKLGVSYTPSLVFFDERGAEVFRLDAYVRPFHLAGALDYVASGAYKTEPQFQRYLQAKADAIRAAGGKVQLW
jgi:thioredoxin-related protein